MTDSVALRAIYALRTRLEAIDGTGAYNTSAGGQIYIARGKVDQSVLPCLILVPGDETAAPTTGDGAPSGQSQAMRMSFEVNVEGHVTAEQSNTGEQLEYIKADIKRAVLLFDSPTLADGNFKIGPVGYLGSTPSPRDDGSQTESVQCRFRVTYTEKFGDPNATK